MTFNIMRSLPMKKLISRSDKRQTKSRKIESPHLGGQRERKITPFVAMNSLNHDNLYYSSTVTVFASWGFI